MGLNWICLAQPPTTERLLVATNTGQGGRYLVMKSAATPFYSGAKLNLEKQI
jgi:hypothetical protein